jgi:hypothetical protein
MSGWLRYLELTAKSKTGLSARVFVLGFVAVLCAAVTVGFFIYAIFVWLAEWSSPLTAALVLGGLFLLVTIILGLSCQAAHRRTIEDAKLALQARSAVPWSDPQFLSVGLRMGRAIGWRWLVPLVAAGVLASGVAKEWHRRRP